MIDKVVRKVTGFHYFYGIAQINAGKLYGVTVLAFKKNDTLPSEYLLRMYSGLVALSLKRKQAELELQESETKLRVLNADKDRFMQIIAHDLRNPFNALLGFSKLLLKNIHKYDIEKIENQLQIILQTTQKTGALLDNLLLWSNAQSGKLVIEPQKFEFSQICQQIIDDVKPHADSKEIAIHCFESEKTIVYADLNMFKAILRNLISNAIKFTKRNGHIDVYAEVGSQDITIVVSDNGVGIEEKKIPKLWDFAQPMSTVGTAAEKGTGFGLLLCKELVEKHDGTIWVESIAGKGSDFKFTMTNGNLS
jgi:signal transduction histidine kinase